MKMKSCPREYFVPENVEIYFCVRSQIHSFLCEQCAQWDRITKNARNLMIINFDLRFTGF